MKKAAIIGAGVSGLIVGARLAQAGFQVDVFESSGKIGGRAIGQMRDGFSLDYGLHMVRNGVKGHLTEVMERLGVPIKLHIADHPEFLYYRDGRLLPFPEGKEALMTSDIISMDEKMAVLMMLRDGLFDQYKGVPLSSWLESVKGSAELADFARITTSCIVCPFLDLASSGEVFDYIRRRILIGSHPFALPEGGYYRVLDKLADYILAHGGAVHLDSPVRRIMLDAGRAAGVETDSGPHSADIVVPAFPYKFLFEILDPDSVEPEKRERLTSLTPTAGVCIDFALDSPVTDSKNIIITYGDPFIYAMAVSNLDPTLAPAGKQLLAFAQIARAEEMADPVRAEEIARNLERVACEIFPEIPNKLLWKRELKLTMINSAQVNYTQHRDARPDSQYAGIPGLYLAGDALAMPGGGGDLSVASANLCVDAILSDL
ncbi:MAG: NAD(P)/FAD-dependent oxidoreductase [bacterium]